MKSWKAYCPLMKGTCVNGFVKGMPESEDGDRTICAFFIKLAGTNPQTGEIVDDPGCSIHFMPIIQLEGNQHSRQVMASTDKVANEVRKHHATFVAVLNDDTKQRLLDADPRIAKQISNGNQERPHE